MDRNWKLTGESLIATTMLWDRFTDLLTLISNHNTNIYDTTLHNQNSHNSDPFASDDNNNDNDNDDNIITLLLPPYEVFETALNRLTQQGIFKRNLSRISQVLIRTCVYTLKVDAAIITVAFKDNNTTLLKFI